MPPQSRKLSKGVKWRYLGSHNGQKYCSKAIYLTRKEALDAEREFVRQLDEQQRKPRKEIMLLDFLNVRLDYIKSKSTFYYKEHQRYLKALYNHIGNIPVHNVTRKQITEVINEYSARLKKSGKTQHKANAMLRIFKATFFYGINLYELDIKNPATGIKLNSIEKRFKYIPSDEDIEAVLAICNPEQQLLMKFVRDTGCRVSEALNLASGDVYDDFLILYTRKAKNGDLTPRRASKPDYLPTFKGRLFKEWTTYPRFLEEKVKLLKQKPWNFHNLRHRYASRLSKNGTPLFEIMVLLGHANLSTTQGYLQLLP